MKKHISILLTMAFMTVVVFGCKVGADDPASMASRNGRLLGTWKLTNVDYLSTAINFFGTQTQTKSYNGTILTTLDSPGGTTSVSYSLEMIIDKGGILKTTETEDGDVTVQDVYWEWLGDDQDKSQLQLYTGSIAGGLWIVTRLASKELVLMAHNKSATTSGGTTDSNEESTTLTFTAQ